MVTVNEAIGSSMSDILTQLQTTYDHLLTQMFSTLSYLTQRHPLAYPAPIDPSDPFQRPNSLDDHTYLPGREDTDPQQTPYPLRPDTPRTFEQAQQDLAEDLVVKGVQIEQLIENLPGKARDQAEQESRIRELVDEVMEVERLRKERRAQTRIMLDRLEKVVGGMSRSVPVATANGHG